MIPEAFTRPDSFNHLRTAGTVLRSMAENHGLGADPTFLRCVLPILVIAGSTALALAAIRKPKGPSKF